MGLAEFSGVEDGGGEGGLGNADLVEDGDEGLEILCSCRLS